MSGLKGRLFGAAEIGACFTDQALVEAMLEFEGALALAEADAAVIAASAAQTIAAACSTMQCDLDALGAEARKAGTLTIPFVKRLTAHVATHNVDAARYVHWGATSQDVVDCALALQVRRAAVLLRALLVRLGNAISQLAEKHHDTPMAGRTLLQAATPVTFGWKAATWLTMLTRSLEHFDRAAAGVAVLQFGGASGVLGALGKDGWEVANHLARRLGLGVPDSSWHSARDNVARLGSELAIICGAAGKIARDVVLLMQSEVAEVSEPAAGGSSAMPHKRNPVGSVFALEAFHRAPGLAATLLGHLAPEHERGFGQWQSQWWTVADLFGAAGSALSAMADVCEGLKVDVAAMAANMERTNGFVFAEALSLALAVHLGKSEAHRLTQVLCDQAAQGGADLQYVATNDPGVRAALDEDAIARAFDPANAMGAAGEMTDWAVAAWRSLRDKV